MRGGGTAQREPPAAWVRVALAAVLALAALVLYRAPALWLANAWLADPYYTHALLVAPLAIGLGAWRLWKARTASDSRGGPLVAVLLVPVAAYGYGFATHDAYWLTWSAWLLAGAVLLATGGWARLKLAAGPLLLLALCIPTPWTIETGVWLQGIATAASVGILAMTSLPLVASLYTFQVGDVAFEVTPACSGFQSAVSLLAIGAVLVTLVPMSRRRRILVLAIAVPLALALNVGRILAVVGVGLRWGPAAAESFFHGWSGALLFLFETAVLIACAGLLRPRKAPGVTPSG